MFLYSLRTYYYKLTIDRNSQKSDGGRKQRKRFNFDASSSKPDENILLKYPQTTVNVSTLDLFSKPYITIQGNINQASDVFVTSNVVSPLCYM